MQQQLVTEMADSDGVIDPTFDDPADPLDVEINIRQDDLQLFETESNRLLLRTAEMPSDMYLEPVPTSEGVQPELVADPTEDMAAVEPAEPAEQPDVSERGNIEIRMD